MVFPIVGGTQDTAAYEISNSLRFNDGDSPRLNRTTSTATNDDMATLSAWVKRSTNDANQTLIGWNSGNGAQAYLRVFNSGNNFQLFNKNASESNTSIITNAKFRDTSAWYHVVVKWDAAQGTDTDRVKLYVNGVEQTLGTSDYPPQNTPLAFNVGSRDIFMACWNNNSEFQDGYVSEFAFIDGQALAPTSFAETDDNGVWIPKEFKDDVTFGNNGFYLEFKQTGTSANSSGIGADTSGNDNHWTPTNLAAIDITTDTPTNNFATMNPLDNYYSAFTFSEGNCKFVTHGSNVAYNTATIGDLKQGKWYLEVKYTDPAHVSDGDAAGEFYGEIAVIGQKLADSSSGLYPSNQQHNFAYGASNGRIKSNNTAGTVHGASISADGQIIGFLIDLDNDRVTTHLNGQYADGSGNHDESSPTAYVSITDPASTPLGGYMIGFGESVSSSESGNQNTGTYEINFGNPSFSISSGNADANGYGNFEYAVPSGYYALCTKNLAEYG